MHWSMAFAKPASEVLPPSNSFHNVISQSATFNRAISQIRSTARSSATLSVFPTILREDKFISRIDLPEIMHDKHRNHPVDID
jgi:hypothetical protein